MASNYAECKDNINFVRTPIIIVTALNDEDSKVVALGAGANDYLTKPFHIDELNRESIPCLRGLNKPLTIKNL